MFRERLLKRDYPTHFVNKYINKVKYQNRKRYISGSLPSPVVCRPTPILKTSPITNFSLLGKIVLHNFDKIANTTMKPRVIQTNYKTLSKILVRAKIVLPEEKQTANELASTKPKGYNITQATPKRCSNKRCQTCQYFNTAQHFISTKAKRKYRIRESFTCASEFIIYLITCKKCKKQYVGKSTKTLRERMNRHVAAIKR